MIIEKVKVPEWKSWLVEIRKFKITESEASAFNLWRIFDLLSKGVWLENVDKFYRWIVPWEYTKLMIDWHLVMSDTPVEMADHEEFVRKASGVVLIAGLWIGMVANAVAKKDSVSKVVVVEINNNVIKLVKWTLHKKIEVVQSDIFKFHSDDVFDYWWFDIWTPISDGNLKDFKTLRKKFKNIKNISFWAEPECKLMEKRYKELLKIKSRIEKKK